MKNVHLLVILLLGSVPSFAGGSGGGSGGGDGGSGNTAPTPAAPSKLALQDLQIPRSLVTYNGDGHTAYGRGNSCINDTVDAFLLDGKLPKGDPDC